MVMYYRWNEITCKFTRNLVYTCPCMVLTKLRVLTLILVVNTVSDAKDPLCML